MAVNDIEENYRLFGVTSQNACQPYLLKFKTLKLFTLYFVIWLDREEQRHYTKAEKDQP